MSDKKRILIIEDDMYTRDLFKEILTGAGHDIETAVDGLEGLEKIRKGGWSLVLLDAMMPKMDGLTLLARLKETPPKEENGPIILCTNLARDAVLHQALSSGAKGCIIKADLNPDQLVEKVSEYLPN